MATSENILLKMMSGHLGKQLVIRQYGDKTVVSKYPDMSRRKLSAKQKQVNKTMIEANVFAKKIMINDKLRNEAQLRLNVKRNKLYTSLIKEYFNKAKNKD
jgi:disulfide oxidoreductase YuzD